MSSGLAWSPRNRHTFGLCLFTYKQMHVCSLVCCSRYNQVHNYMTKSTGFVVLGLSSLESIGNSSGTMEAHLEIAPSLSSVYSFSAIVPVRPAVLSHSVVSVHIVMLPSLHTQAAGLLLLCVTWGLSYNILGCKHTTVYISYLFSLSEFKAVIDYNVCLITICDLKWMNEAWNIAKTVNEWNPDKERKFFHLILCIILIKT